MEFHRPDIEGFDRKGLVDHVRPSVVKKNWRCAEPIYLFSFGWISWFGMKICRSNTEDSTRKGLGEPVKTFGSFWLLKSSCLDKILYQSITHHHQPLQRPYCLKWNSIGPTKKIIVEKVCVNHLRPFGSFVLLQNDKKFYQAIIHFYIDIPV